MRRWLEKLKNRLKPGPVRYEREKGQSRHADAKTRLNLARSRRTHPEILYYLAEHDPAPVVRQAVAGNRATPVQASPAIARDPDIDVRLALAGRLVRLLPALGREDHSHLYAIAVQALTALAADEILDVRLALSSALKDCACAPPGVVSQLARDAQRQVAEPILRFCTAVPDDVLLSILHATGQPWVREAIANRKNIHESVSAAVIETGDLVAGRALLSNPGAQIPSTLLGTIIARARELPEWQEPIALRKNLPPEMAKTLAEFAQESVRRLLIRRGVFDRAARAEIDNIFRRRLAYAAQAKHAKETPYERALTLLREGRLDEAALLDSMGMRDDSFAIAAIAVLAQIPEEGVVRVVGLKNARPLVALCWKAGLSMRCALRVQQAIGKLPPDKLLYPRGGTDYPLSESEMAWQIDFLGLGAP